MHDFTPLQALAGGTMIGLAAASLWIANGRVAGISGILGGALAGAAADHAWRLAFLGGLLGAPLIYAAAAGPALQIIEAGPARLVTAGLLVGIGTRLGNGCTSGHGVCGVARLSHRSIAATGIFMMAAMATVFAMRHIAHGA
jgi:uncharacterized membrane protein YedE/YeeE